jgi:GTPase SAR1 family protein
MQVERDNTSDSAPPQSNVSKLPVLERLALRKQGEALSPVCVIVVGMAGSGKTTLMAQLQRSLEAVSTSKAHEQHEDEDMSSDKKPAAKEQASSKKQKTGYCVNLDPATLLVPFGASIDIRDTVDYKQVMQQHRLGPNGAVRMIRIKVTTRRWNVRRTHIASLLYLLLCMHRL